MRKRPHIPTTCPSGAKQLAAPCVIHGLLDLLAKPWTMHILWALGTNGPTRFGSLRRKVEGISSRVLTERLRVLEKKGFVYRHYEATIPPAVTYGITNRMKDIERVFQELDRVAQKWQEEDSPRGKNAASQADTNHKENNGKKSAHAAMAK
jgi:DNA-binding HxlR family transcriptional regulator